VVIRCSKVLSDWEMGIMVGSWCWMSCTAGGRTITGYSGNVGAGRASIRGDVSISMSLELSGSWRLAISLVWTIMDYRRLCKFRKKVIW
jgi:hypothetical protein